MPVQEPKRNNKTAPLCCYCSQCGSRSPQMEIADQDKVEDNINHARQVMIYTIDRETPDHDLQKATHEELDRIAERIRETGIPVSVSY